METINNLASEVHERSPSNPNNSSRSLSASATGGSTGNHLNASSSTSDRFNNSDVSNASSGGEDAYSSLEYEAANSNNESTINGLMPDTEDVLDHYRFILLLRNQFMQTTPFQTNAAESGELRFKNFDRIFNNLKYHYREMMSLMDGLSEEAMAIMDIYKDNI
jgi:hypothetical protein